MKPTLQDSANAADSGMDSGTVSATAVDADSLCVKRRFLRAGPLSAEFEPASGMLRTVRLGDTEILRGVYAAVRDADWQTVPTAISLLSIDAGDDWFRIAFTADCVQPPINFSWRGTIVGEPDGKIVYEMDGVALSEFAKNRIGLCVLHPLAACLGRPCRIETTDGRTHASKFPQLVSPHQPFVDVRAIAFLLDGELWVKTTFEGDTFETEDQRNWSDASFKTYSTPLALPFPVRVSPGFAVRQRVTLQLDGPPKPSAVAIRSTAIPRSNAVPLTCGARLHLPDLGLCAPARTGPAWKTAPSRLKALRLSHLRVDLHPASSAWEAQLSAALHEAAAVSARLDLALHLSPVDPEQQLRAVLSRTGDRPESDPGGVGMWLLFQDGAATTPDAVLAAAKRALADCRGKPSLAVGTDAYLAELNRNRPPPGAADFFTFSLNPQVHATDTRSIVESLESLPQMIATVRSFCGDARVMISPITLQPRFNPNATTRTPHAGNLDDGGGEEPHADARQTSTFLAAWTLACVAQLARCGADRVTFYQTFGPHGVMSAPGVDSLPADARRTVDSVYSVYHVFADLGELAAERDARFFAVATSGGDETCGVVAFSGRRTTLLMANLGELPRTVLLGDDVGAASARIAVRALTDAHRDRAMASCEAYRADDWRLLASREYKLAPWSYTRIDTVDEG